MFIFNLFFLNIAWWRRQWHPTPVLLPGKSHGRRSLVLQSLGSLRVGHDWVALPSLFTFIIGEGNGNALQCSCLENPRDRGAWWAAVYGVAQSQTQLKWLSVAFVTSVRRYLLVVLIYISLIVVKSIFSLCLLAICISSLEKCVFQVISQLY